MQNKHHEDPDFKPGNTRKRWQAFSSDFISNLILTALKLFREVMNLGLKEVWII